MKNINVKNKVNTNKPNEVSIVKTEKSKKIVNDIKNDKNILVNEDYTKNFIDFEIKVKEDVKKKITKQNTTINTTIKETKDITTNFKQIEQIVLESYNIMEKLKNDYQLELNNDKNAPIIDFQLEIKMLKTELINYKIKNEFLSLQSKFYENIFYTCKNCIENYNFKNITDIESTKNDLKSKLNSIFTQNNKYYVDNFNLNLHKENKDLFSNSNYPDNKHLISLTKIENELFSLLNNLNKYSYSPIETSITEVYNTSYKIKTDSLKAIKSILSYYILEDDFNKEFKHKINFFLENEDKFIALETKQRSEKIIKEFSDWSNCYLNKVMTNKMKNELVEKINNLCVFYENFNVVLRTENMNLKNNTNVFLQNSMLKVSGITKLVDNYLNFNEGNIQKINEILDLAKNKSIKNIEKVLFTFIRNEENVLLDTTINFNELRKNYVLIK